MSLAVNCLSCFCFSFLPLKISENGEQLNGNFERVEVLSDDMGEMMGAFAVDDILVLFTIENSQDRLDEESKILDNLTFVVV